MKFQNQLLFIKYIITQPCQLPSKAIREAEYKCEKI